MRASMGEEPDTSMRAVSLGGAALFSAQSLVFPGCLTSPG